MDYILLKNGDIIEQGDEIWLTCRWEKVSVLAIGERIKSEVPVRRLVK